MMDCGTTDIGKEKNTIVNMVNPSIGVGNVAGRVFVPMGSKMVVARNVEVNVIVSTVTEVYVCGMCGRSLCAHGKQKYTCADCGGRGLCKTPHCTTIWQGTIGRRRPLW